MGSRTQLKQWCIHTGEWCAAYGEVDGEDPVIWAYDVLCHSGV